MVFKKTKVLTRKKTLVHNTYMIDIHTETMQLLKTVNKSPKEMAADTGLGKRWLERLMDGDYNDPGVKKIQKLHDYLTRQRLSN